MDTYEWQKNFAVVNRIYYSENCLKGTTFAASAYTAANLVMIRNNYFKKAATAALLPIWKKWLIVNVVVIGTLLRPLTYFEIEQQWRKRCHMGRYLFSLYHLETAEEMAINKKAGNRFAIIKKEGEGE